MYSMGIIYVGHAKYGTITTCIRIVAYKATSHQFYGNVVGLHVHFVLLSSCVAGHYKVLQYVHSSIACFVKYYTIVLFQ